MQVRTVGSLLSGAADELRDLQRQLRALLDTAAAQDFTIGDDGSVTPPRQAYAEIHDPDASLIVQQRMNTARDYARRVGDILTRATEADSRCARALSNLVTHVYGQEPYEYGDATDDARAAAQALGLTEASIPAAGSDPTQVNAWWKTLTPEQRQLYLTAYPERFGALDGMPSGDRDYANQLALRGFIGDNVNNYRDQRNPQQDRARMLLDKLERSEQGPDDKRLYLLLVEPVGDGKAAVAVGDPDTADRTAVLVPGVGTELDDIRGLIERSSRIQDTSMQLSPGSKISVVGWLGYDTPSLDTDVVSAVAGEKSRAGAAALNGFVNGLHASHQGGGPDNITAIGHSYGSTVLGEAASTGDGLAVNDIVAVGSPGMRVEHAAEFNVPTDHVWAGAATDDNFVARPENTAQKIPIIGDWLGGPANQGIHGPGPHYPTFGGNVMSIDTHGHSGYWDNDSLSLQNQAAIVAGDYELVKINSGRLPPS